jgi:hypothetical protein
MVKRYLKEYLSMWESIFDIGTPIQKKKLILFVCVNFLFLSVIYKMPRLFKYQIVIDLIATIVFLIPFFMSPFKKDVPKVSLFTVFKIMVIAVVIGLINGYAALVSIPYNFELFVGMFLILAFTVLSILFVIMAVFFFNVFNKDRITNVHLQVYFVILGIITTALTKLGLGLIISFLDSI